jgi:hypothetical protein
MSPIIARSIVSAGRSPHLAELDKMPRASHKFIHAGENWKEYHDRVGYPEIENPATTLFRFPDDGSSMLFPFSIANTAGAYFRPLQEQNSHWKSVVFERLKPTDPVESMDPKDSAYIILRAYYTGSTEAALKASQLFLLEHLHNMGSSPVLLDLCDIMRAL